MFDTSWECDELFVYVSVEGGHRAIMFNRISGIQRDIYPEGLHFRIPWFQNPIIYNIRYCDAPNKLWRAGGG